MIAESTPAIEVGHLTHHVGEDAARRCILQDVSLQVETGQCVALIGRSGSGKSTLLNLISGLEPIMQGEVRLAGQAISTLSDSRRTRLRGTHIGFIYQAFNLIPTLTVAENISLPLALSKADTHESRRRLRELLEATGLHDREHDYPDRLSGGEQQRVAIARALIHRPSLILADEPTGNLDADSGRRVLSLLGELVAGQGAAMLLVTHSQEVAAVADRIIVLDKAGVHDVDSRELLGSSAW